MLWEVVSYASVVAPSVRETQAAVSTSLTLKTWVTPALERKVPARGPAEITQVRRQHHVWQREAPKELATERTAAALERYEQAGMVHAHATQDEAKAALVEGWDV